MDSKERNPSWELLALVIAEHLDPKTLAVCCCVCKSWHAAMSNEHLWKIICLSRWPSLSEHPNLPVASFRSHYSLRHRRLPRRNALSLDQFIFVFDLFKSINRELLSSFVVAGEDLIHFGRDDDKFQFTGNVGILVPFSATSLILDWVVMLKGHEAVFTIMDGQESEPIGYEHHDFVSELPAVPCRSRMIRGPLRAELELELIPLPGTTDAVVHKIT